MPDINVPVGSHPTTHAQLPGNQFAPQVVVVDPVTGLPVDFSGGGGGGLTDTELRAAPVATTDTRNGTRQYDFAGNVRQTVTATSTAAVALPTLYASREVMVHAAERCVIRLGGSDVAAATVAAGQLILEAGERFHFRVATGVTHFRVIRDTTDGFLSITAVVL
jgi:hypothetical protein